MSSLLFDASAPGGDWQRVWAVQDHAAGLRAIIVLHSLTRGPAFGGIRRLAYASEAAALADARQLAHAMSQKCALAGLAAGGGKTVVLDHPGLDRRAGYAALGRAIDELGGRYVCGPDIGTTDADLDVLRSVTQWVNPAGNDAGRSTAAGVLAGLRGLSRVVFGDEHIGERSYVIQGLGAVGSALAAALIEAGARVSGFDPNPIARERARALGVIMLDEPRVLDEPCDVFMPCALGHVLTREVCERAPWRAVCGSANNQLADDDAAACLHRRQISWAPDIVVNAGAVIEGVETVLDPSDAGRARAEQVIQAIATRCEQLLIRAREQDRSPQAVARELGEQAIRASATP